jgi:hypothetical protein
MHQAEWYELTFKEVKGAFIARNYDFQGFNEDTLSESQYISTWPLNVRILVKGKNPVDNLFCPLKPWLLVSKKVRKIFEDNMIQGIQFLPVIIELQNGFELPGYSILNIIRLISGLDYEHTTWLTDQKWNVEYPQLDIFEIALTQTLVDGNDIFRIKQSQTEVFISKRVKSLLVAEKVSGFTFIPIKSY